MGLPGRASACRHPARPTSEPPPAERKPFWSFRSVETLGVAAALQFPHRGTGHLTTRREVRNCAGQKHEPGRALVSDTGSITPLILGMTLCILLLVAGVTATGSAFLSHNRLQNQCDGAALVASDAAGVIGTSRRVTAANSAAITYLAIRPGSVGVTVAVGAEAVTATCWASAEITFGAMFLTPTLDQTVTSSSRIKLYAS